MRNYTTPRQRTSSGDAHRREAAGGHANIPDVYTRMRHALNSIVSQPLHLQELAKEFAEADRQHWHWTQKMIASSDDLRPTVDEWAQQVKATRLAYLEAYDQWQDDMAWLADVRNDCECHDGTCLYCQKKALFKRYEREALS